MTSASEFANHPVTSEGSWRRVADGVYMLIAEPDSVNIGLVVGNTHALLIDCGSTVQQGRRLRTLVTEVTDLPLAGVAVTHEHRDHWFGLAAFDDVPTWGQEILAARLDDPEVLAAAAALGLAPGDLRPPTRPFVQVAVVDLGDRRVELVHLGHAHSPADAVAYVPDADVMFTGDLIENPHPWFGPEASPRGWPGVLNLLIGMVRAETVVVPGHGEPVDHQFVVRQMAELSALPYEAERLVRDGVPFEQAELQGEWLLPWPNIAEGVRTAYAELRATGVRPRLPLA